MSVRATAEFLHAALRDRRPVDRLPEELTPGDLDAAYGAQAALVELLEADGAGAPAGYKVGCTNRIAMELLGAEHPFYGRVLRGSVLESGATVPPPAVGSLAIEPEYAYVVADVMPESEGPFDAESVVPYLGAIVPSIELIGGSFTDITAVGMPSLVAHNALNLGWVAGTRREDWTDLDLGGIEVTVVVDGEQTATGTAENVLGHPLNVVAWLANELNARATRLEPGDIVSTGTCTAVERLEPGSSARCRFGPLGDVRVAVAG
jgi:2-keto-4-pentenoate hydratase